MTKPWLKFVKRRSEKEQQKILEIAEKITFGEFKSLDIDTVKGSKNKFRCRIGKIRIIFRAEKEGQYIIEGIGNRGDIY